MSERKKLSSKMVHENPYFSVREDKVIEPDGKSGKYFVVTKNPSVFVVAVTEKNEVVLVKLYRYMTQCDSIEVPAGGTDGEDPLVAAKRELQEETGYTAEQWQHLAKVQGANGISDQMFDVYLATKLKQSANHQQEEEGITEILKVPLSKVPEMIRKGEVTDLGSVGVLFIAINHLLHRFHSDEKEI